MKRKNLRSRLASLVVFLLVGVMGVTAAVTAFNEKVTYDPTVSTNSAIQAGRFESNLNSVLNSDLLIDAPVIGKKEKIDLIVEMDENTLIDKYLADNKGYATFAEYRVSPEGMAAAEALIKKQKAVFNKIARQADVKLKYNYVNIMNGFSMEITYGDREIIDKIAYKANVTNTLISERYEAPETQDAVAAVKNQVSALETGIFDSSKSIDDGYAGQGMVVGILDTGIDFEHIAFDPNYSLFGLEDQEEKQTLRFTKEYIEKKLNESNDYGIPTLAANLLSTSLTIDDVYHNAKIPYTFDYADNDPVVSSSIENSHGTHVAGIIAGHSDTPYKLKAKKGAHEAGEVFLREVEYTKGADGNKKEESVKYYQWIEGESDENGAYGKREYANDLTDADFEEIIDEKSKKQVTGITGVAPAAQLAIFKVFSDNLTTGAESAFLLAALEDCVTLDVDVINMSLGADCGFQDESDAKDSIFNAYQAVEKTGISLVVAASNSFSSGFGSHYGLNLTSNPDSGMVGSPASYDAAFTVASISGVESQYILATDERGTEYGAAYYAEAATMGSEYRDFIDDLKAALNKLDPSVKASMIDNEGNIKIEYVTVPGVGDTSDFAGLSLQNKIALVKRGEINFEDKIKNARSAGAIACVVYNNAAGMLHMQIGDSILGFPCCSITMDAAFNIKDKDKMGKAYFVINEENKAGPFISDFSSWGPLPNLVLKPEITAHGGEIYSAIPGDETAYSRLSGTSMACPNTSGVVLILRQYLQNPQNDHEIAKQFEIWDEETKSIDKNLMERRIYQLLMSTATIAHNEQDNPYSPRKQGAGLADLERARAAKQYIYVNKTDKEGNEILDENSQPIEAERTKIELYDDPNRSGVYEMTFYVKNVDKNNAQQYKLGSYVMTEGVSTDGKTVNEMSHVFKLNTEYTQTIKTGDEGTVIANDATITVEAGKTLKITYTIELQQGARDWLAQFVNGMYVDGFVCLENEDEDGLDLNIPYLAFYGDWSDAPIMDYDVYETSEDENDDTIPDDEKRYAGARPLMMVGKIIQDGQEYSLGMGQFPFTIPDEFESETPDAEADKCAITFDTDSGMCGLYGVGGFLRPAKKLFWQITDALTGEVIQEGMYGNARKANGSGGVGGAWLELDIGDMKVQNNVRYNMAIYPVLDWNDGDYTIYKKDAEGKTVMEMGKPVYDVKANIEKIIADNEEYNKNHPNNVRRYYWTSDFWVDTEAPFISNVEVNIVRNSSDVATYILNIDITDNHYAMGLGLSYFNKTENKFVTCFSEEGMRPINGERNSTTRMQFNITDYWDQIHDGLLYRIQNPGQVSTHPELSSYLTTFRVELFDYAFNKSYYEIDLYDIMTKMSDAYFGDIGNYTTYKNTDDPSQTVTIMSSTKNEVTTDRNGEPVRMNSFTIVEGQMINLMRSVVTTPANVWREDYVFSVSDSNVLDLDNEKGEIYAKKGGNAIVYIKSLTNPSLQGGQVNVTVLSKDDAAKYNIPVNRVQSAQALGSINFTESGKVFNAGEKYIVEFELNPWYVPFDPDKYEIVWSVSNSLAATVEPLEYDPKDPTSMFKATVTASDGYYELDDETGKIVYHKNYSILPENYDPATVRVRIYEKINGVTSTSAKCAAEFPFYVLDEFEVEGNELKEYHGTPDDFEDPTDPNNYEKDEDGKTLKEDNMGRLIPIDNKRVEGRIVIPDNITIYTIGNNVFYRREDITEIKFPHNLTTIGYASCAYMTKLERVELPDTLEKIDGYAFAAYIVPGGAGPETRLSIVDFTKCTKPIQVQPYAFVMQRYIGVDMEQSEITDLGDDVGKKNKIVLLDNSPFDLKMVRVVGEVSFYGLNFVKHVDLSGLRSANSLAFYGLGSGLKKYFGDDTYATAVFGENTAGGLSAFVGTGIGDVEIGMRRISSQMFVGDTAAGESENEVVPLYNGELKNITFTADNLVIEDLAFIYSSVENITFKGSVKYIGEAAFGYSKLKSVKFENSCEYIGDQAFYATELTEITLPKGLKRIGNGVFTNCKELKKVYIDKDCELQDLGVVPQFGENNAQPTTFAGCTELEAFEIKNGGSSKYFTAEEGVLYSKDSETLIYVPCNKEIKNDASDILDGVKVIASGAFGNNQKLTSIDLSGIEKIGSSAFFECENLKSVTLPQNIEEIPDQLFLSCTSLSEINFESLNSLTSIGKFAFAQTALETVTLPDSVKSVGISAFAENEALTSFSFTDNITKIEDQMFYNCNNLKEVKKVIYVDTVGEAAFMFTAIEEISLNRCKTIENSAFANCEKLAKVTAPQLETIGEYAFFMDSVETEDGGLTGNGVLKEISLDKIKTIGDYAFSFQVNLKSVNLRNCETIGAYAFLYCSGLESIGNFITTGGSQHDSGRLRYIGDNAFTGTLVTLSGVTLPESLEYISSSAFTDTRVASFTVDLENDTYFASSGVLYRNLGDGAYELVTFPTYYTSGMSYEVLDGTVRIAPYSFYGTEYLVKVDIPDSVRTIGHTAFYGSSIKFYNFMTLNAPELEANYETYTTEYNDVYFWQVYDNFYMPFTFTSSTFEFYGFKYNPIRIKAQDDVVVQLENATQPMQLQNDSYLGEGFIRQWYGIMVGYPSNASGFDSFVWSNYFDEVFLTSELVEDATKELMAYIESLPNPEDITLSDEVNVRFARNNFNSLRSDEQRAFVRDAGLVAVLEACEAQLATLSTEITESVSDVRSLIDKLPLPSEITLDDEASVVAAREAYNKLSGDVKTAFDSECKSALDKLAECEKRIDELKNTDTSDGDKEGCGSCSTVAFGSGSGGGTGLMIGLGIVMLACLMTVLMRKKKSTNK